MPKDDDDEDRVISGSYLLSPDTGMVIYKAALDDWPAPIVDTSLPPVDQGAGPEVTPRRYGATCRDVGGHQFDEAVTFEGSLVKGVWYGPARERIEEAIADATAHNQWAGHDHAAVCVL